MSYALTAILVDIDDIASVIGCNDRSVIDRMKARDPEAFQDDAFFEEDGDIGLETAIGHLVCAAPQAGESAYQYGYALQHICSDLGTPLSSQRWLGVGWDAVAECGLSDLMLKTGPPVPLPQYDDFPRIGHIRQEDIQSSADATMKTRAASADRYVKGLLEEYVGWLQVALEQGRDIVFFYH